ncbi:hypothetical protein HKI87_13g74130 [Chloropicon roscoffensis]|uniref:Uncharacterized protein n=1 Tax=Chloropicon roscoffensis TaxID=1461544 RepID=A0AAX4PJ33_9CHLO
MQLKKGKKISPNRGATISISRLGCREAGGSKTVARTREVEGRGQGPRGSEFSPAPPFSCAMPPKILVRKGSVKARSSFFEGLQGEKTEKEESPDKVAKPKWMQDLARKTDAHNNVVDKQLKSKLRERKMIVDGKTPRKLPPREDPNPESPELAAMLQKARARAEAESP